MRPGEGPDNEGLVGDQIKAEFQALSQDALAKASEQFLSLAEQRFARQTEAGSSELDTKKQLIDQQLANMNNRLEQVSKLVNDTETKRQASFSQMDHPLARHRSTDKEFDRTRRTTCARR